MLAALCLEEIYKMNIIDQSILTMGLFVILRECMEFTLSNNKDLFERIQRRFIRMAKNMRNETVKMCEMIKYIKFVGIRREKK